MSTLNVNMLLQSILNFVQRSHGLYCEDTSKVILLHHSLYSVPTNWLYVRSNLVPGLTYYRHIEKKIICPLMTV